MECFSKTFDQLSKAELYGILRLRAEVFVLEQNCPYVDIDNLDQEAMHLGIDSIDRVAQLGKLARVACGWCGHGNQRVSRSRARHRESGPNGRRTHRQFEAQNQRKH